MRLTYRNSEIHPAPAGPGIASIAHVFTDAHSGWVFAYCEMRDGNTFWCNKPEDRSEAPLGLMFAMLPPEPWTHAITTIPPQIRLAALQASKQGAAA